MTLVLRRDELEVEALVADRYVEALLAAHARRADDAPAGVELDPAVRATARQLASVLPRVHPSFRFTEALASDLAAAAGSGPRAGDDTPMPIEAYLARRAGDADAAMTALPLADLRAIPSRPLLIGGAVASALSLAGAAVLAWRLGAVSPAALERVARATGRRSVAALAQPRGRVH